METTIVLEQTFTSYINQPSDGFCEVKMVEELISNGFEMISPEIFPLILNACKCAQEVNDTNLRDLLLKLMGMRFHNFFAKSALSNNLGTFAELFPDADGSSANWMSWSQAFQNLLNTEGIIVIIRKHLAFVPLAKRIESAFLEEPEEQNRTKEKAIGQAILSIVDSFDAFDEIFTTKIKILTKAFDVLQKSTKFSEQQIFFRIVLKICTVDENLVKKWITPGKIVALDNIRTSKERFLPRYQQIKRLRYIYSILEAILTTQAGKECMLQTEVERKSSLFKHSLVLLQEPLHEIHPLLASGLELALNSSGMKFFGMELVECGSNEVLMKWIANDLLASVLELNLEHKKVGSIQLRSLELMEDLINSNGGDRMIPFEFPVLRKILRMVRSTGRLERSSSNDEVEDEMLILCRLQATSLLEAMFRVASHAKKKLILKELSEQQSTSQIIQDLMNVLSASA